MYLPSLVPTTFGVEEPLIRVAGAATGAVSPGTCRPRANGASCKHYSVPWRYPITRYGVLHFLVPLTLLGKCSLLPSLCLGVDYRSMFGLPPSNAPASGVLLASPLEGTRFSFQATEVWARCSWAAVQLILTVSLNSVCFLHERKNRVILFG